MVIRLGTVIAAGLLAAACGADENDPIRFEYTPTPSATCAQTEIGFHPDSAELTGAAEDILYDTVDQIGSDCEDATIEITAWRDEAGDDLASERLASIESAIRSGYGLPNHYISGKVEDPPGDEQAGRVGVALVTTTATER